MAKVPKRVKDLVDGRSKGACEYCGGRATNIHHRVPRGMGGSRAEWSNAASNLLNLCGSGTTGCHGWAESHRAEAYALGLLVHRWDAPPSGVPFTDRWGVSWLVTDDGGKTVCLRES